MGNKYKAYSVVAIRNLILNSSLLTGFVMNIIMASILATLLLIFKPDLNPKVFINFDSNSLSLIKLGVLMLIFFLFNNVSLIMQDVMQDRDSKVSEIINTSIGEKHYIFGKLMAAYMFMIVLILSLTFAIIIVGSVFTAITSTGFNIFNDIIQPMFNLVKSQDFLVLAIIVFMIIMTITTSILFTLALSIKIVKLTEAPPVALVILLPYFILFGLFLILPVENVEQWTAISLVAMFIPLVSPIFILINIAINGFGGMSFIAILISIIYIYIIFRGTTNIYKTAFYTREKLSILQLIKYSWKGNL